MAGTVARRVGAERSRSAAISVCCSGVKGEGRSTARV